MIFDKQKVIERKKANIIEGYWDPMEVLWRLTLYATYQGKQKYNMIAHSKSKHWQQHIVQMAPRNPRAHLPTNQQYLAIFYHRIICLLIKLTMLQAINDGSFATYPGITEKMI